LIPEGLLPPRQIRFTAEVKEVACSLKLHRGSLIPVLSRGVAAELVRDRVAAWEPQRALLYSKAEYLADEEVKADPVETKKVITSGAATVLVAIIGESRSALAVCRNIVKKCQLPEKLEEDAAGAVEAALVYLVED